MGQPFDPQHAPQAYPPQPPLKKGMGCGTIALIVGAIAVPVIGIFAWLAISGMNKYLRAAKESEAKVTTASIYRAAENAFEREGRLCGSSTQAPREVPSGRKIQPGADEFETGDAETGWRCLRFAISTPSYYAYSYELIGTDRFKVVAKGDLDGDGEQSSYVLEGRVAGERVGPMPQLEIINEGE